MRTAETFEIEEPIDRLEDDLGMLQELLGDEEPELETLVTKSVSKRPTVGVADMSPEEFRAYKAGKQAERRAKLKEREANGSIKFDAASTRDALADAALMILAHGLPGTDTIQKYLERVFADQVGAPLTITARARSGDLKPKLIRFAVK
ncbi:hypothetical protein [Sinorhizobium fredii]|uniref:hypothetical protein n=1 Tax=Rhizobium fredii TaxID=380 RepID=UPI003396648E